jgi:hypothetical protein
MVADFHFQFIAATPPMPAFAAAIDADADIIATTPRYATPLMPPLFERLFR